MAAQITNEGAFIKIVDGASVRYVNKVSLSVAYQGNDIHLGNAAKGYGIKFLYTEVDTPSSASAAALAETINGYI